jgi:hypothetical protein
LQERTAFREAAARCRHPDDQCAIALVCKSLFCKIDFVSVSLYLCGLPPVLGTKTKSPPGAGGLAWVTKRTVSLRAQSCRSLASEVMVDVVRVETNRHSIEMVDRERLRLQQTSEPNGPKGRPSRRVRAVANSSP